MRFSDGIRFRSTECSFFLLFYFLLFQRKAPLCGERRGAIAKQGLAEAKERKKKEKEETSRKETICGEAVAGGVQTPASPISRLVVKHWALGRFRGAARLCRCFRSRRGARLRAFYTRLRAYDEKGDHLFCSIETTSNRQQEREIGS